MAPKIVEALREYQTARAVFLEAVHEAVDRVAKDPFSLNKLLEADVLRLLCCPLVQDVSPGIQIVGLEAMAKLTAAAPPVAAAVTDTGAISYAVLALQHESRFVRRASNSAIQAVASCSLAGAHSVMDAGALAPLRAQLEELDLEVKEAAVRSLNALCSASSQLADSVLDAATLQVLVDALRAPDAELAQIKGEKERELVARLKTAIASILGDAAMMTHPLAERVVEADALPPLCALAASPKAAPRLRSACFRAMAQVTKHSDELADLVVSVGAPAPVLVALLDPAAEVRASAALLVRELACRSAPLAAAVADGGGLACMVQHVQLETTKGSPTAALPTVLALGFASDFRAAFAGAIVAHGGAAALVDVLTAAAATPATREAAAWAMEQMARHGAETALPLARASALPRLLDVYQAPESREPLREQAKAALKAIARCCGHLGALEPLVAATTPTALLKHLLPVVARILPDSADAKRSFVASGALMRLQQVGPDPSLDTQLEAINALFPPEVVEYYRGAGK